MVYSLPTEYVDGSGKSITAVFQNAILGFQVFQIGLKNVGSQGFNALAKGAQDLSRNVFRSFQGISMQGQSIFGKLTSVVGSSLEGLVTIAGNVASNIVKSLASIPKAIGGIVGYFVWALVLPGISGALAEAQEWWADNAAWFDVNQTRFLLFDSKLTDTEWVQLAVTSGIWVLLPLLLGLRLVMRSEVK